MKHELLNITQLAAYINIPKRTLYRMVADGRFPVEPVIRNPNRWSKEQVERWLSK